MRSFLFLWMTAMVFAELPPSCDRPVYCNSNLLHCVQLMEPKKFTDSKTFVDLQLVYKENETLAAFDAIYNETNNCPERDTLDAFIDKYFHNVSELESWNPPDYNANPKFLANVRDETLKQYAKDLNDIWPTLGRKVKAEIIENPDMTSLIPVTHGFIIPGGRFTELYYWDTYFIIKGLLLGEMNETVRGKIENLLELLKKIGHIPNGSRWYYQQRSQPPLLTAMVALYIKQTNDKEFLKANIGLLEEEVQYWLDSHIVTFEKDHGTYTLLRYYSQSKGPRPESYREDYTNAQTFPDENRQQEFYMDLKSAAESGWDFSSRWFRDADGNNNGSLTTIHTGYIIPVDLNAIFANALDNLANFQAMLGDARRAAHWGYYAKQWKSTIQEVLWDEKDGIWHDYDFVNNEFRRHFYPTNTAPLWMNAVDELLVKKNAKRIISYLRYSSGLINPGGVPVSLEQTGEQWDFPNAWPPTVSIIINAIDAIGTNESSRLALHLAQIWVRSCFKGYNETHNMYEKYDVRVPGKYGDGGEYVVQSGFGWSNGVVLEFIDKYGQNMTAVADPGEPEEFEYEEDNSINNGGRLSATGPALTAGLITIIYYNLIRW